MNTVFDTLVVRTGDQNFYLKGLNCLDDIDFNVYRELAGSVTSEQLAELLRDSNWRLHLVAYLLITSGRRIDLLEELKARFVKDSFVSPQIGVAIVLLEKRRASVFFQALLGGSAIPSKLLGATLASLRYCFPLSVTLPPIKLFLKNSILVMRLRQRT